MQISNFYFFNTKIEGGLGLRIVHNDIPIIGAGPQALTMVTHLLKKKKKMRDRLNAGLSPGFQVFDPSGTWLAQWHRQFPAQEIPHLRSPAVHHPDSNPVMDASDLIHHVHHPAGHHHGTGVSGYVSREAAVAQRFAAAAGQMVAGISGGL